LEKSSKKQRTIITIIAVPIIILVFSIFSSNLFINSIDYKKELAIQPSSDQTNVVETDETESNNEEKKLEFNNLNIINILFLGIDRTLEGDSGADAIYRSDSISLIRIDLNNKQVKVLAIPRDTYTYIPIKDKYDKITHAYAYGSVKGNGPTASIDAINDFIKYSKVNYYFTLDLKPFPDIVDALGGVEIDVEMDMINWCTNLKKGKRILTGKEAYDYIHWRYSANGDIDRIERQQKMIKALYEKLSSSEKMLETAKIILKYHDNIKTDLTIKQILALAKFLQEINSSNISYHMIPGTPKNMNKISYWVPYEKETDMLLKEIFDIK